MISHPSPNHGPRTKPIRLIVLHATAGKTDAGDIGWMQRDISGVSYHVCIGRDGTRYTLVDDKRRAWHAGLSKWKGITDVNSISLGLAWCNRHDGTEPLTPAQIAEARKVIAEWRALHPTIEAIVTHKEIAPGRKSDPHKIPNFVRSEW